MKSENEDFVSIKELERQLGLDRSNTHKVVKKICKTLGIESHRRRTPDSGGQQTTCFTKEQANRIVAERSRQSFAIGQGTSSTLTAKPSVGVFYVLQLVPELDPHRVKLGYTNSLHDRLATHRTAVPSAKCVKTWPCKAVWERAARDSATRVGARLFASEVFEVDDVDDLIERVDQFFALMPGPDSTQSLTEHSPLRPAESE